MPSSLDDPRTGYSANLERAGGRGHPERKRILVIGASGGVGAALIDRLLAGGHEVMATVRAAEQIASVGRAYPAIDHVFVLDMALGDSVGGAIRAGLAGRGAVDAVVVCTGVAAGSPLETASLVDFRRTLEINTVSCLAIYQAVLPMLRETRGRLLLVSSYAGKVATPFIGAYSASKHALEALGDVMRQEAVHSGVRISLVLPGGIDTAMCAAQLAAVNEDILALSADQDALYGHYYRGHRALLAGPGKMPADEVAAVVEEAITAREPRSRYVVGTDAQWFIDQRQSLDDKDFDVLAESIFHRAQ